VSQIAGEEALHTGEQPQLPSRLLQKLAQQRSGSRKLPQMAEWLWPLTGWGRAPSGYLRLFSGYLRLLVRYLRLLSRYLRLLS
jgi:hypothetical protein